MYVYIRANMQEMQYVIVPSQLVKLLKDLSEMLMIAQLITIGMSTIRALGLDLKKFDFNKDLMELNIEDVDNEEFEVSVNIDSTNFTRLFRKKIRYLKYAYLENRQKVRIIVGVLLVALCITIGMNIKKRNSIINQHSYFSAGFVTMSINNTYLVKNDYLGNAIYEKDTKRLIVVSLKIKSNKKNDFINTAKTELVIGKNIYYPTSDYNKEISDLGVPYTNQKLTTEFKNYILVYEVPTSEISRTIKFRYLSSIEQTQKSVNSNYSSITLSLINLDKLTNVTDQEFGDVVKINQTILKDSILKIDAAEIAETFTNKYKFCLEKSECYDSVEYIVPTLNSTQDKVVLKLTAKLVLDEGIENSLATTLESVISSFGKITYTIGKETKTYNSLEILKYTKNKKETVAYFEVPKEILESNNVVLRLKIRNDEYRYKIQI